MKSKLILFFITSTIALSCTRRTLLKGHEDCRDYYTFVKKDWIKEDSTYHFRGYPAYNVDSLYNNYFSDDCLFGLTEKQIKFLFGEPNKIFIHGDLYVIVYCMSEHCCNSKKIYGGRYLAINFDIQSKVKFD